MLTVESARKIGVNACIDRLGRGFVQKYRDTSTASYTTSADDNGNVFCFVGVDDKKTIRDHGPGVLVLDCVTKYPYFASCNVNIASEAIDFLEIKAPKTEG